MQNIKLFHAENVGASVGLLIDNSGSMLNKRADLVEAALAFASASDSDDEMFVVNFNENVYLGLPASVRFTRDPDELRSALLRTAPAGLTALYDALAVGIEVLSTPGHVFPQTGKHTVGRCAILHSVCSHPRPN